MPLKARAYVNYGRWIADCPREHCANAEKLAHGQGVFNCSNCNQLADVQWPPNADELWQVLQRRPVPDTRNWFPPDHELAVRSNTPHGQTAKDLEDENRQYGVI